MLGCISNKKLKALIVDMRTKDTQVFVDILEEYKRLIDTYASRIPNCSEDYKQSSYLFLYELLTVIDLRRFKDTDSKNTLSHYIAVCIRNHFYSYSKNESRHQQILAKAFDTYQSEDDYLDFLVEPILDDARKILTDTQFRIIVYKYVYMLSDVDIGKMLNITRQSVNQAKNRALANLRKFLGDILK